MTTKYKMLSKEVAPGDIRSGDNCGTGTCPAVLKREDGKFVVIGKVLSSDENSELNSSGIVKVYNDECAILVDPAMLSMALEQSKI